MSVLSAQNRLERWDPGSHRRIKGLRLVTAFGLAAMAGRMPEVAGSFGAGPMLSVLAGGFALWASVSEARCSRGESTHDLVILCFAAAAGAVSYVLTAPWLAGLGSLGPECLLVSGAFCTGYLRRYGLLGTGVGSQFFLGQLLAYGAHLGPADIPTIAFAGLIASVAAVIPRILSGPAEKPAPSLPAPEVRVIGLSDARPELAMGLQAAAAALVIIALTSLFQLSQPAWGITAAVYVIAGSSSGTMERVRGRILGTAIGVPLGLACLPLAHHAPLLLWFAAALAMIVYSMSLPERYDIASGAFAFTLVVTLAAAGEHSIALLLSRGWETALGGTVGLLAAFAILPLQPIDEIARQ